ncbi:alpha/beta hydrolase [Mucilaginibacter flavus]|uniref:alpha/beta hydrolase n=1 Tax=Mucilaginibacter flavus TaxID=931504 RepID=UPI0025B2C7CD|nr:alpha/beta hydrolase [Mucilaginibacter flavus]MDN3582632.1 alpha/beta hydrolase [Mucilaginibacter flavus]
MKTLRILSILLLIIAGISSARAQQTTDVKPTIIFVHGIWADGSGWSDELTALQAKGYPVVSVQNPLTSLTDDVAATKRAIDMAPGKVILVGHSWGGFVITQAGNDPKVTGLVYIAAFAPNAGETVATLSANGPATEISKNFINTNGFIYLSKEGVKTDFAQDLNAKQQELVYATQVPASQTVFGEASGEPAWKVKPNWFIVTKNDRALSPALQRFMAKRINAKTTEIESSHVVLLSHPKEVLQVIEAAANTVK